MPPSPAIGKSQKYPPVLPRSEVVWILVNNAFFSKAYPFRLVDVGLNTGFTMRDEPSMPHGEGSQGKKNSYADEDREGDVVFSHEILLWCVEASGIHMRILQCHIDRHVKVTKLNLRAGKADSWHWQGGKVLFICDSVAKNHQVYNAKKHI